MNQKYICATCGHDNWSHAFSLDGEAGACMEAWCSCEMFVLFSPKKQYNVRVRVRFIDCAKPLIYFDDEEIEDVET